VHPAVVGRLTAAVLTYVLNGRASAAVSYLPPEVAAGRGGLDQEVESDTVFQRGQADRALTLGTTWGHAAVGRGG